MSLAKGVQFPLHHAIKHNQVQVVRQLIAAGVDVKMKDEAGRFPFELALEVGNDVLTALLLRASAGVNGRDKQGWAPLHFAQLSGAEWLVREFIQDGADVWFGRQQNAFEVATLMNNEAMLLRVLAEENKLTNGASSTWSGRTNIAKLIEKHELSQVVKDILSTRPSILPATSRAQLALIVDDEAEFRRAINAGADHTRVWSLLDFRADMFEKVVMPLLRKDSVHYAAARGDTAAIAARLAEGWDVDAVDSYGWTALHYAVFCGQEAAVSQLCAVPANVDAEDNEGIKLATLVSSFRNISSPPPWERVRSLLKDYDAHKGPAEDWLHYYIRMGRNEQATALIAASDDAENLIHRVQDVGRGSWQVKTVSAMHVAARHGNLAMVKYLHEEMQMDVDYAGEDQTGNTSLHEAAQHDRIEVARYLLTQGAEANGKRDKSDRPLHAAATYNNLEVAELLLENGADVNATTQGSRSALHSITSNFRHFEMIELLVSRGAIIYQVDAYGRTPLDFNVPENVRLFLYAKATEQDIGLNKLLHMAIKMRRLEDVQRFIAAGADPNAVILANLTALQVAAEQAKQAEQAEQLEIARVLLDAGADPNVAGSGGMTPLMIAIYHNDIDLAELLFAKRADPALTSQLAKNSNHKENALQMLEKRVHNYLNKLPNPIMSPDKRDRFAKLLTAMKQAVAADAQNDDS